MTIGTILLLEDDEGIAQLAKSRLERSDYKVVWIHSPESFDPATHFDLMVIDFILHDGTTGLDFYKKLAANNASLPAILITGFGDEKVLVEALRAGVRDFIPKNDKFLEVLPLVVKRVMTDVMNESRLLAAEQDQVLQKEIESALAMANIGYWSCPFSDEPIVWPTNILPVFPDGTKRSFLRGLLSTIAAEDRQNLWRKISQAKKDKTVFEVPFKLRSSESWYRIKGNFEYQNNGRPCRAVGMLWDETDKRTNEMQLAKSLAELEQLTERLKLTMMETHHRVKNSFQIVRSLLNMELRKEGFLSEVAVKKVISYVQGLALIHDILTDSIKSKDGASQISAHELLERLVATLQGTATERTLHVGGDSTIAISARMASTLAVVTTELLMNALKHGLGNIELTLKRNSVRGELSVVNGISDTYMESLERANGTGLGLVQFLAKTDFKSSLITRTISEARYEAIVEFPCI